MRKGTSVGLAMAAGLLLALPARAQDAARPFSLGVTGGSLGLGPEAGVRINPAIGLRASASFLDFGHDFDVNDIVYDGKVKLESYGANIDLYPLDNGFRVSAGFRVDHNRVNVSATPTVPVTVGDISFTPAQIGMLSGTVWAENFAPMLTLGYAGGLSKAVKFGVDAGAMFQGRPTVRDLNSTGMLADDPIFVSQLARERQDLNDKMRDYKVYPILQLSLFYAF